jgi:hypothetical protein
VTFLELAYETLKKIQAPLTDKQIWEKSQELGFKIESAGKTPWRTIGARIYIDIKENPQTKFIKVSSRPTLFFIKDIEINKKEEKRIEKEIVEIEKENEHYNEKDLHVLLTYFLKASPHFECVAKTINEKVSHRGKKGENEWLHPDMVGVHFSFDDYNEQTKKLINRFNIVKCDLFSFEIKKKVTFSTLRQYYFQAVSNSSWANEGYLVALDYGDDSDLMEEMQRLANSFGIGFIKLNPDYVEESEILVQADHKDELDWDTINKLAEKNKDFAQLIDFITEDLQVGKIKSKYDRVLSEEEMKKYIDDKQIKENK